MLTSVGYGASRQGRSLNKVRYLTKRVEPMTLIIGFACGEGVALVSDTKVTDIESLKPNYQSKILTPLQTTPFIIGAAGYTDLFYEFNRKIPLLVNERVAEYEVKNIEALLKTGLNRDEAIDYLRTRGERSEKQQQPVMFETKMEKTKKVTEITLPYVYTYENLMDDCKELIKTISSQVKSETPYPLEVLVSLKGQSGASLHHINANGRERAVETYYAIGSGSDHVKMFFERLYDYNKRIFELIGLAFLTIEYVQTIAMDPYVGYSEEHPPEAVIVQDDGNYGRLPIDKMSEVIKTIKETISSFDQRISSIEIPQIGVKPED